jgi:hypothetical protein
MVRRLRRAEKDGAPVRITEKKNGRIRLTVTLSEFQTIEGAFRGFGSMTPEHERLEEQIVAFKGPSTFGFSTAPEDALVWQCIDEGVSYKERKRRERDAKKRGWSSTEAAEHYRQEAICHAAPSPCPQ